MNLEKFKKYYKSEKLFFVVILLLIIFVRLRLIDIAFERDEGEYTYAAQQILRGKIPYLDFYNMKLPGIYYFFALVFSMFYDNYVTVKITLLLVNLINAFMIYQIAKKNVLLTNSKHFGFTSAAIYLLISLGFEVQGWTANAEHFTILPSLIGILLLLDVNKNHSFIKYFLSGCFMCIAFIFKQHAVGYILVAPIWLISKSFNESTNIRFDKKEILQNIKPLIYYALGGFSIVTLFLFYFYFHGALQKLIFFTFDYAVTYGSTNKPFMGVWRFRPIFYESPMFYILIFVAIYFYFRSHKVFQRQSFLMIFFLGCFLSINPGWYYRPHYFQLLLPGVALLSGFVIVNINELWPKIHQSYFNSENYRWSGLLLTAFLQSSYFFIDSPKEVTEKMYCGDNFSEIRDFSLNLPQIIPNVNTIGMLGAEPQMFFYSKKTSASGFLYHYPIFEKHKYAKEMFKTFTSEIETNKPEIFIFFCNVDNFEECNEFIKFEMQNWYNTFSLQYDVLATFYSEPKYGKGKLIWESKKEMIPEDYTVKFYVLKRKKKYL